MVLTHRFLLLSLLFFNAQAGRDCYQIRQESILINWYTKNCCKYNVLKDWIRDIADLNRRLFSVRVWRPLSLCIPIYAASRSADEKINCIYYDKEKHKNLSSLPKCIPAGLNASVTAVSVLFGALRFFTDKPDLQLTSNIFAKGSLSIWLTKNLIKNSVQLKICQRPKCEDFDHKCIYYGGFPSGHMAVCTYLASWFWMRQGPKWGLPLTLYTGAVFGASLAGNRHYLSQLVGGVMLGLGFTFASKYMLKAKLKSYLECNPTFDGKKLGVEISYAF